MRLASNLQGVLVQNSPNFYPVLQQACLQETLLQLGVSTVSSFRSSNSRSNPKFLTTYPMLPHCQTDQRQLRQLPNFLQTFSRGKSHLPGLLPQPILPLFVCAFRGERGWIGGRPRTTTLFSTSFSGGGGANFNRTFWCCYLYCPEEISSIPISEKSYRSYQA